MIFKRVPSFSFIKSEKKNAIKIRPKTSIENSKKNRSQSTTNIKHNKKDNEKPFFKTETNIKYKSKILPSVSSVSFYPNFTSYKNNINKLKKQKSYDKNNHSFKFNHYSSRRPLTSKMLNDRLTYIEPFDYSKNQKNLVNYKKMSSRNDKNSIYSFVVETPSSFLYRPKYDYIEPDPKFLYFDSKSFEKTRKFKVSKIMKKVKTLYDVPPYYISVDNKKLGKREYYEKLLSSMNS